MTLAQLETIYKANIGVGLLEALEAVYTHGYFDGAGLTPSVTSQNVVPLRPAPTTIIKFTKPSSR